jgi:uncharacterized repeat protein (TIGR01451 family)
LTFKCASDLLDSNLISAGDLALRRGYVRTRRHLRIPAVEGTNMRRIGLAGVLAMLLAIVGFGFAAGSATAAGTSVGSFEIDGNTPDSPAGEPTDWDAPASAQNPPLTVTPFSDKTGRFDDSFGMGSKQEDPGTWSCITGSSPGKGDITPGGKIAFRTINGKQFVYVNFTRATTTGSADLDYEFNQSSDPNPACPALPKRTVGDIVLAFDADNGGKTINVRAFSWTGTAVTGTFVPLATGSQGVTWDGATNGDGSNKTGDFGEAVLNLTDTIGEVTCGEFSSVFMKSRSSTEINSALQDRTEKKPVATGLCPVSSLTKTVRDNTTNPGMFGATTDAQPGDILEYHLTYSNAGPGIAHNVVVTDTLAAGQTVDTTSCIPACSLSGSTLTWTLGTVAAGASVPISFRVQITGTYAPGTATAIKNTATATSTEEPAGVNSGETTVTVKTPITSANKDVRNVTTNGSFADSASAAPGNTIEYRVIVTNAGPGVATGVVATDAVASGSTYVANSCTGGTSCSFASGTVTWQVGTLASGASATLTFRVTLASTFPAGTTQVKNTAVIDSDQENPKNSDETIVNVTANPVTSGDKSVRNVTTSGSFANTATASPGDTLEYQIIVTNNGSAAASGVVVTDAVAANSSYVPGSCAGGTSCSFSSPTVTWQVGTLAANGGSATLTFRVTLAASFPAGTTQVKNTAVVDSDQENPHNSDETTVNVSANPNVTGNKDVRNVTAGGSFANTASASPGDTIEYRIVLTNSGNAAATGVVVTDAVAANSSYLANSCTGGTSCSFSSPTVTWQVGSIAANGGTATLTFRVTLASTFPAGTTQVKNTAVVDDDQENPKSTDETTVNVGANPNVTGDKDVRNVTTSGSFGNTASASPGDTIEYRIVLTNSGNAAASGVVVTDAVAANSSYVASSCTGGTSCSFSSPTVTWQVGSIAANGGTATLTFRVTLASSFPAGTTQVKNTAVIDDDQENPKPTDETTTNVSANPNVTGNKDVRNVTAGGSFANTASASPGDTIEYRIVLTNSGNAAASGTTVTDAVAAGSSYVANSCTGGTSCTGTATNVSWTVGTIAANGGTATLTFRVTLAASFPAGTTQVKNTAVVDDDQESPKPTDETTVNVTGTPNLTIAKAADQTKVVADDTITYTLTYGNTGNATANGSMITETVPSGTSYVSCTGGCTQSGGTVTWDVGAVTVGGGGSVTLTVKVDPNIDSCAICNVAKIASPNQNGGAAVSSNQVCVSASPAPDPSTAKASGDASGLKAVVGLLGIPLLNVDISKAASSQTGPGQAADNDKFASLDIVGVVGLTSVAKADLLTTTSSSQVSKALGARQTSTSEVLGLNVLSGVVTADVVRSVASTTATGTGSSNSAAGSTATNLKVLGNSVANAAPGTKINLPSLVFGNGAYVAVNEQTGSTSGPSSGQLSGGTYTADLTVTAVRVVITGGTTGLLLGATKQKPAEITVARATAHSEHKQTRLCTSSPTKAVSGHAFIASAQVDPLLPTSYVGFVDIPASGGTANKSVTASVLPSDGSVVSTNDAASNSTGTNGATSSTASSYAQAAGACVLKVADPNCLIKATLVRSQANSSATSAARSSDATGTQFVDLVVAGIPIAGTPPPNTTITLPLKLGYVVLNEQVPDGPETGHTGLTVRAIHVKVYLPLAPLLVGAEVIVAEAHSDALWR